MTDLKTISVDEATEKTLSLHADHTVLARGLLRDNFRLLNTSRILLAEYDKLRDALGDLGRNTGAPLAFAIRRMMAESEKRIAAGTTEIDKALGEVETKKVVPS